MELKHIKELMTAMGRNGIKRLAVKREGFELELEREGEPQIVHIERGGVIYDEPNGGEERQQRRASEAFSKGAGASITPPVGSDERSAKKSENGTFVKSPMVGTFYTSPSPEEPTFIKIGDSVSADTVVCIIEAMKVMNEVKAGVSGTIKELMVENSHPVEFGTPLYRIEPAS